MGISYLKLHDSYDNCFFQEKVGVLKHQQVYSWKKLFLMQNNCYGSVGWLLKRAYGYSIICKRNLKCAIKEN